MKTIRDNDNVARITRCVTVRILVKRFADWCHHVKLLIAKRLQGGFERLPPWAKNGCIIFFVLAGMVTFTSIVASSIKIRSPVDKGFYLIKIQRPRLENHVYTNVSTSTHNQTRILQFEKYMDSLSESEAGRFIRDSIIKARPGLMDSMTKALNLIQSSTLK